jgi:hypothetical protein
VDDGLTPGNRVDEEVVDPFAADYFVASVERLDEPPQPAPAEPRVASLESMPPVLHR